MMQHFQNQGLELEDKLRGMILSNSGNSSGGSPGPPARTVPPAELRTDMLVGGGRVHDGTPMTVAHDGPTSPSPLPSDANVAANKSPRSARKRPNQAQRRQMSAQLSIPIDPRPLMPPPAQYHHHHVGSPQYSAQHSSGFFRNGPHQQYHNYNPHQPNSPHGGGTYANYLRMRNHLSPPFHGSTAAWEHGQWRSPPGHPDDPNNLMPDVAIDKLGQGHGHPQRNPRNGNPSFGRQYQAKQADVDSQADLLNGLCNTIIKNAEISYEEIARNEGFRAMIEHICRLAIAKYEAERNGNPHFPPMSVQLKCFGSLSSGFATKASDMDLGLLSPLSHPQPDDINSPIPRILEKAFLEVGLGARLLTRTRVPIIKLCEKPPEKLRLALVEKRAKWERGEEEDHEQAVEEEEMNEEAQEDEEVMETGPAPRLLIGEQKSTVPDVGSEAYNKKLAQLRQTNNSSLAAYYGLAKRLLRRLGGRDISNSNIGSLGKQDFRIVTDVARAFVRGLADVELSSRLQKTFSISTQDESTYPVTRSLAGVYNQTEGEALVMAWEKREVKEKEARMENEVEVKLRFFADLQNKATFGLDPLGFAKELKSAVDLLKRIPSIQIQILKQAQYEPPAEYHARTIGLLLQVGAHDTPSPANTVLPTVIRHYIAGIWDKDIREQVMEFVEKVGIDTLRTAARCHKSLQLALEFEKALKKGLYEGDREVVSQYVSILRRPMQRPDPPQPHYDFVVPIAQEDLPVLAKVKSLPHPAMTAANQPRDPYRDHLEFPSTGAGVQCDINFSAHLALQNTLLLRCYSHTDPRVRPLVLFVKHWAKVRGINTPYRGTLSSYGYVLMMLHYLVNVAQPFVCPNLQQLARPPNPRLTQAEVETIEICKGRDVRFWRDEDEIKRLAAENRLNQNKDSIGHLLRGFFEYYAQSGMMSTVPCRGFDWGRDVLSLRTPGGLRTKLEKGWTGAKTIIERQPKASSGIQANGETPPPTPNAQLQVGPMGALGSPPVLPPRPASEVKEVRHRYLFAIEDPFELDHNVARTVTHNGIVSIRDEFRRAWRIIKNGGGNGSTGDTSPQEELLQDVIAADRAQERDALANLLEEIHSHEIPF